MDSKCQPRGLHPLFIRIPYNGELRTGWYSGRTWMSAPDVLAESLDYIKLGPYISKFGPLSSPTTNQRIYRIAPSTGEAEDITLRMRKHRM